MLEVVKQFKKISTALLVVTSISLMDASVAGTIVRVSTSVGDYSLELLDDVAPITVQNFLSYVNRNDYNNTYLHRVIDGFVVQGGGYRYQPFVGPIDVVADAAIVNEYNVSNTRGTVAMAKIDPLPDSATNQWFVNLADNSANLDNNNGGFTVFANVLGEGMTVLDAIDALPYVSLGLKASEAPYFTETYSSPLDFVYINAEVVSRHSSAVHVYDSGLLISSINVDDGTLVSLNMNLTSTANGDVFEVNLESIIPIQTAPEGVATYSSADMRLRIPTLEANIDGGVQIVTNVVLIRTSPDSTSFSLESYDQ